MMLDGAAPIAEAAGEWTAADVEVRLREAATASLLIAGEPLSWLSWLDPDDADLVLARLGGAPWKPICWRFGISRPTADRRWRYALALVAWHLNGHAKSGRTPSLRSLLGLRRAAGTRCETSAGGTGGWGHA